MNDQASPVDGSLRVRVRDHLGVDPESLPVIGEAVAIYNRVNLQLALDAWAQGDGRAIEPIWVVVDVQYNALREGHYALGQGFLFAHPPHPRGASRTNLQPAV